MTLSSDLELNQNVNIEQIVKKNKLLAHDKFCQTPLIGRKIGDVLANLSQIHFDGKMEQLNFIYIAWNEGKEIALQIVDPIDNVKGNLIHNNQYSNTSILMLTYILISLS